MKKSTYLKIGINIKDLSPVHTYHPGEELRDELKARKVTQKRFAELSGIHSSQLNEIIKGKRGISADIALMIGTALDMNPELWAQSQMYYELTLAKIRANKKAKARPVKRKLANAK